MRRIKFLIFALFLGYTIHAESVEFPSNAGIINVKDYGAKGDGITDDTKAFNDAINKNWTFIGGNPNNFRFIYIPNGTYLVTNEIFWMRWLVFQGQSEAKTIIKLKDNCEGYQDITKPRPVLHCRFTGLKESPWDGTNNSSFANYIQNLTVNTGTGNPGTIGIQYNNHNEGAIRNVSITSGDIKKIGKVGLDLSETEFGPGLIKNVTINGFDIGIKTIELPSNVTLENITIKNQLVLGIENHFPMSLLNLVSFNKVKAISNGPEHIAQLVLINANLTGGDSNTNAIENIGEATIYLRNINAKGYSMSLNNKEIKKKGKILEYWSGEEFSLYPSPRGYLKLPVKDAPLIFEEPISKWVFIDPSAEDDTKAIQDAIDGGASTLYLKFDGKYQISNTIYLRANVRRIVGMNANINANPESFNKGNKPMFVVQTTKPLTIEFFHCQQYAEPYYKTFKIETNKPIFFKSCKMGVSSGTRGYIVNTKTAKGGNLFFEDTHEQIKLKFSANLWCRHYNPENNPAGEHLDAIYIENNGGNVWVLGFKTEGIALNVLTTNKGRTEILGGYFRDHIFFDKEPPFFVTENASISASYYQYDWDGKHTRTLVATEKQGNETKSQLVPTGNHNVILYRGGK